MTAQIVSFHCILKDRLGHVISSSFNQNVSTGEGEESGFLRGFTRGMQNLTKGEKRRIYVSAKDAYGYYDMAKVIEKSREELPAEETIRLGDVVFISAEEKQYRVIELKPESVTLDSNHPLAGQDLIFEIEATEVREDRSEDEKIEGMH